MNEDHTRGSETMGRSLAALFAAGGTIGLTSLLVPHWSTVSTVGYALCTLGSYATALALVCVGRRLPRWAFHVVVVAGTTLVTLGAYFAHGGAATATAAFFYIWVALFAFHFFSRRAAMLHVALVGLAYALVLWALHAPGAPGQWVVVVGFALTSGLVVGSLVDELRVVARHDGLTGLLNRRALEEELRRELARASREEQTLSIAVIDLDFFKACNDAFGHQGGDALLIRVAAHWAAQLRPSDSLARYGGDEFALLLPRAPLEEATRVLERLRAATPDEVGFSAGVAAWNGAESTEHLISRADGALYEAKRSGRNRTVTATFPPSSCAA